MAEMVALVKTDLQVITELQVLMVPTLMERWLGRMVITAETAETAELVVRVETAVMRYWLLLPVLLQIAR